jgi:TatD family-associated radical SAM protein
VDSVNVSLNAPNAEVYAKICPNRFGEGAYDEVKKFILAAKAGLPWVQASVVGMPGVDVESSRKVAEEELGVRFRHREYDNVG